MDEVIRQADFLSLHLPGGAATRHMIGYEQLSEMKESAYLINTGRGEVVNEKGLKSLLSASQLYFALLRLIILPAIVLSGCMLFQLTGRCLRSLFSGPQCRQDL